MWDFSDSPFIASIASLTIIKKGLTESNETKAPTPLKVAETINIQNQYLH